MEKEAARPTTDVESGREGITHWQMILDQGVVTNDIVNWEYDGEGTEEDPFVVEWIENDPRNPMTFAKTKKWIMALAVANSVLVVSFCSSAFSGGMFTMSAPFHAPKANAYQVSNRLCASSVLARKSSHSVYRSLSSDLP